MYILRRPAAPLRRHIEWYWFLQGHRALDERIAVDGKADLLFNFGVGYTRTVDGAPAVIDASNLDGPRTRPAVIAQAGGIDLVGVRFRPAGLAAFVPLPLSDVTDLAVDVRDIFGDDARRLESRLHDDPDPAARSARLDAFFAGRLAVPPALACAQALLDLAADPSVGDVAALLDRSGLPARTLSRVFVRHLGLPPKFFLRVARFERATAALVRSPDVPLAELALACGYYDQAHLCRECGEFAGRPPTEYRDELRRRAATPPPTLGRFVQAVGDEPR